MSPGFPARRRIGIALGTAAPILFLAIAFAMAAVRRDVIGHQGWVSWPSSMGIGGWPGAPQILAFLILGASYPAFAWWSLRPAVERGYIAFTIIGLGELFLAFPTDARGAGTSWHGTLHLIGVLIVTAATAATAAIITRATWGRTRWRPWHVLGMPSIVAGVIVGVAAGFHSGIAKVFFVLTITLPIPLLARLVASEPSAIS